MSQSLLLHPDVADLAFLLGTWEGDGVAEYPTTDTFAYLETIEFGHVGKPFLTYRQTSTSTTDGRLFHGETGFWRRPEPGRVALVMVHPFGAAEVAEGSLEVAESGGHLELRSTFIGLVSTAKRVTAVERTVDVEGDRLRYSVRMAAVGESLAHHLSADLRRR